MAVRELELLRTIYAANRALPDTVTIPPGDDMGAIRVGDVTLLVTVDQVADGVHFDLEHAPLAGVGRKAVARNLSDVAAMAAKPVAAVAAGCLPRDFGKDRADQLFEAMRAAAAAHHCPLIGGDVAMWDGKLLLSVTVFAEPAGIEPVLRRGAKVGDGVFVTGELGRSLATGHHLTFEPRVSLARTLALSPATRPNCMIDLSDGLAKDLPHLCRAAGVGAVIDAAALPLRGDGDWRNAVGDGEDYELLFTSDKLIPGNVGGVPVTRIGEIVAGHDVVIRLHDGTMRGVNDLGWEHHG